MKREPHDPALLMLCLLLFWALSLAMGNLQFITEVGLARPCAPSPPKAAPSARLNWQAEGR